MIHEGKEWHAWDVPMNFKETTTPATPPANYLKVYAKDSGGISTLAIKNDAGNEVLFPTTAGTLVTGTGAANRLAFWNGTSTLSSDAELTYSGSVLLNTTGQFKATQPTGSACFFALSSSDLNVGDHNRGLAMGVDGVNGAGDIRLEKRSAGNAVAMEFFTFNGSTYAERGRFASDGRLVVGSTSESFHTGSDGVADFEKDGNLCNVSLNAHATGGWGRLSFHRSRNTHASPTVVASGDTVMDLLAKAYGGSSYHDLARIHAVVDGTPGNNDMPGMIVFSVTPDGSASLAEAFRINNARAWGLAGANFGTSGNLLRSNGSAAAVSWQDHTADFLTQYALLAGRSGGQTLIGGTASGNDLTLRSTSHATQGSVIIPDLLQSGTERSLLIGTINSAPIFGGGAPLALVEIGGTGLNTANNVALYISSHFVGDNNSSHGILIDTLHEPSSSSLGNLITRGMLVYPKGNPASGVTVTRHEGIEFGYQTGDGAGTIQSAVALYIGGPSLGTLKPQQSTGIQVDSPSGGTGVTTAIGIKIGSVTGATNNFEFAFDKVDLTAAGAYYGRIPVRYNGLLKYIHVFDA